LEAIEDWSCVEEGEVRGGGFVPAGVGSGFGGGRLLESKGVSIGKCDDHEEYRDGLIELHFAGVFHRNW
jgi:hypothetical protein